MADKILEVKNLKKYFPVESKVRVEPKSVKAVDDVSFDVYRNETLSIVGESGCGKSTTGRCLIGLNKPTSGEVIYNGKNIVGISDKEQRVLCKDLQMIFQDPYSSLNPRMTIGSILEEPLIIHKICKTKEERMQRVLDMLEKVGMRRDHYYTYPHEFSGGMRQRVVIAIALACDPKVLIADEPTTALDVTIQAQILDLMRDLQKKIKTSIIIITHNLGVVANIADRVAVMYGGKLVETGDVADIFHNPCHEYTKGLLRSIPKAHEKGGELQAIPGTPPDLMDPPVGCPFAARCQETMIVCQKFMPDYTECGKNHKSACWMLDEMAQEVKADEK